METVDISKYFILSHYIRAKRGEFWAILDYFGNNVPLTFVSCLLANVLRTALTELH